MEIVDYEYQCFPLFLISSFVTNFAMQLLIFEFYPGFREGKFNGVPVSKNAVEGYTKYELKLPTDAMFSKVYGGIS